MENEISKNMRFAINLAKENVQNNNGGPFGAVVLRDGKIVGQGINQVTSSYDPTAHAEIVAIRDACQNLQTFDLWWGVAYKGNPWREHSTLIVTAKGRPFETGILLDPWRNSGDLYWSTIKDDLHYPWKYFEGPG